MCSLPFQKANGTRQIGLPLWRKDVDKVVTHVDLTSANPSFQYVSKRNVLQELAVLEDQFLDICILVGFDHSPPFPPTVHEQALKATVDMVKYYKTGYAAVSAFAEHPAVKLIQYLDHFTRTRSMIKYSLILSSEGSVAGSSGTIGTESAGKIADTRNATGKLIAAMAPNTGGTADANTY